MSINWVPSYSDCCVPHNAIQAGFDSDGTVIHVGRAFHEGSHMPAKVLHEKQVAYVCYGGEEIPKYEYDILCGSGFSWVESCHGSVPDNALECGLDGCETLFIGRVNHSGSLTPGKICRHHGCIYIPYGGCELKFTEYETLVHCRKSEWHRFEGHYSLPSGAIYGGHDSDGSEIYVGRANYNNDRMPAKIIPSKQAAYVAYGGEEHLVCDFEYLCNGNTRWEHYNGHIPHNAVHGGTTEGGETLYIGRGSHDASLTVGKIHPSHGCLYIPFGGSEVQLHHFEILVEN